MRYVGIDLAWGLKQPTGLAVLDAFGGSQLDLPDDRERSFGQRALLPLFVRMIGVGRRAPPAECFSAPSTEFW